MANHKQKLELTWIGKDIRPELEPRILIEDSVAILNPQKKPSRELGKYAIFQKQIRAVALAACQFPLQIQDSHGIVHKPTTW